MAHPPSAAAESPAQSQTDLETAELSL
jgi:hypothetical protein